MNVAANRDEIRTELKNAAVLMNNPDYFCKNIANISTELWKQNSGNVEDITIIVIFFSFI